MNIPDSTRMALVLLVCSIWSAQASAQTVFRCGNTYSQTPCPGAIALDVTDSRTAEQKAQTDAAARQTASSASKMERERLSQEKAMRSAPSGQARSPNTAAAPARDGAGAGRQTGSSNKKAATATEHFTASVWTAEKKAGKPVEKVPPSAPRKAPATPTAP